MLHMRSVKMLYVLVIVGRVIFFTDSCCFVCQEKVFETDMHSRGIFLSFIKMMFKIRTLISKIVWLLISPCT